MKNFDGQFNVWMIMEFAYDYIEHFRLDGDCEIGHSINTLGYLHGLDPFCKNLGSHEQLEDLKKLKAMKAIDYEKPMPLLMASMGKISLKIKRDKFDKIYKSYSKVFYHLNNKEKIKLSNLGADDLLVYKKIIDVISCYLNRATGLRNDKCRLTINILFSDFVEINKIELIDMLERIKKDYKLFIIPKIQFKNELILGVYTKNKFKEFKKELEILTDKHKKDSNYKIKQIAIVKNEHDSKYKFIINGDYKNYFEVNNQGKYWKLFIQTVQGMPLNKKDFKGYLDYINSNKNNPFIKAGYEKSKILKIVNGFIWSNIPMEIIKEKAFKERLNKQNKT